MSDTTADTRARDGTASDRKMPLTTTAAYSFIVAVIVATTHWLYGCYTKAGWFWIPPPDTLVEMWAFGLAPLLHTFGRIGANYLAKLEKASES
jgi:hypothetical protein